MLQLTFSFPVSQKISNNGAEMTSSKSARTRDSEFLDGEISPPSFKVRKYTYIARKEEKENLVNELEELRIKLQKLQNARKKLLQDELETSLLRDAVKMQQLSLVNVQSAVSGYVSVLEAIPHEVTICLGKDPLQRRDALLVAKQKKIYSSIAYLRKRTRFLDPFRPFSETSRFLLDGGDYCALSVDTKPFDASKVSVHQLYDAITSFFSNLEMRVTDMLGDITTCDETDYGVDGIQQCRYESLSCGVPLEMNSVTFHEFTEKSEEYGGGGPFGVLTTDFVDVDELYPYRPTQRVRHDITAVLTVRVHTRKLFNPVTGREEDESVVVWTRSCFRKQRRTEIPLPPLVENNLREQLGRWGDVMASSVLEHIYRNR